MISIKVNKLIVAIVIMLVAVAVTGSVATILSSIDVATIDPDLVVIVEGVTYLAMATSVALSTGFARNLVGYGAAWLHHKRTESPGEFKYSLTWMFETVGIAEGWVITVTPLVNALIADLGATKAAVVVGAIWCLIDLVFSEYKKVVEVYL